MSEAGIRKPAVQLAGADDDWDTIDGAVRDQRSLLTSGNLLNGSDLMGRLDPLSLFSLAAHGSGRSGSPRQSGREVALVGARSRAAAAAAIRAAGGSPSYAPKRSKDRRFTDPAWTSNAGYWLQEMYRLERSLLEIIETVKLRPQSSRKRSSRCS
jgi:hypothetical protein